MKKQLIATKSFRYAGKPLKANDPFSAKSVDARILIAMGKAKVGTEVPPTVHESFDIEVFESEIPDFREDESNTAEPRQKRRYKRRDMRAEK